MQAEVLNEAFNVNLEALVTREYLESRLDARFSEQKSYMDTRFAQLEGKIDSNQRVFYVTQSLIMAAVILPYLERLLSL